MAKLSAAGRAKVPTSSFGLPSKAGSASAKKKSGNYPMPDKAHARAALRLEHNASPAEQKTITAKANKVLGRTSKSKSKGK